MGFKTRSGYPVSTSSVADLFSPFSRQNERRTNEIPEIDHRHGTRYGKKMRESRLSFASMREREIGALTFDFALNAHSGHVGARICKKIWSGSLNIFRDSNLDVART